MKPKTLVLSVPLLALLPSVALAAKAPPPPPETILHIEATATVPPDQAKITISLFGQGATESEARADLAGKQKWLAEKMGALGIGSDALEHGAVSLDTRVNLAAEEAAFAEKDAAMAAGAPGQKRKRPAVPAARPIYVTAATTISVSDLSRVDALRGIGEVNGMPSFQFQRNFRFSASNPDAARKAAREAALAKARREADEYAASLGYKVVRMTRVSNANPPVGMNDIYAMFGMIDAMPERFMPGYYGATTSASVSIDFVIQPD
ncbi:MAG: SIMPL domain-containing protein [Sphingomonadaceae bacterium]